jgi:mannose-6-phosphate isomerase-like protein (cupin superfamily)
MKKITEARHWIYENKEHVELIISPEEKVWGQELIICREPHAAKIMILEPGAQVSLHWHRNKSETFILIQGELIIEGILQSGATRLTRLVDKFSSVTLAPNVPHTFYCDSTQTEPTIFIEASTEDHPDDSYRIYPSRGKEDTDNRRLDNR